MRVLCLLLALLPVAASAEDNPLGISYVETKDVKVIYFDSLNYLVPHAVHTFTNSLAWQRRTFGWIPSESTTVLLKDLSDYASGTALVAPHDRLVLDIEPVSHAFETFPASERLYWMMNHEMVHEATGDLASEEDRRWRRFFLGKVLPQSRDPESLLYAYLTVPRFTTPRWYLEGAAVFMETWMGGGIGRAQGGYDEMVFRAMVRDGVRFYDPLGLVSLGVQVDFQVGASAYLYGTRFFTWLAYRYSPEKVVDWIRRDEGSERNYADQFEKVFGIPLEQGWQDWIAFEHEFQRRNLEEVRKNPITPQRKFAAGAIGSISRMYYDESTGNIYAGFRYTGVVEHMGALNIRDGSVRRLADIRKAMLYRVASVAYDPKSGTLFYTDHNIGLRDLMAVDVNTGESKTLFREARIGEIVFNPADRSLIGVRHSNGIAVLVRLPYPYTQWFEIHTFPYEYVPSDLDISADGRLLSASISEVNGDQFLRVWELDKLMAGNLKPLSEFRFGQSVPESFVFSKDGRYLYGSSYYTGVSNIFRYEVVTGAVEAVSNAESGFFRPVPLDDGRLLVLTYTGEGFVPATIDPVPIQDVSAIKFLGAELVDKYPELKTWQVPPPSADDDESMITARGPWLPLHDLSLANAYPVLQGYKNTAGAGYRFNVEDPLGFAKFAVTAAYTPSGSVPANERGHAQIVGSYLGWRTDLAWNRSDFYDLFGPTKRSRKGYAAKLGYDDVLDSDEPRKFVMSSDIEYYDKIDTLPNAQNIATPFSRLVAGRIGLHYSDVRRSQGAVDDERGMLWNLQLDSNFADGSTIPQLYGNLDLGVSLPTAHSSVWLRSAAGVSGGPRSNPVSSFYFGGFGNNYVDDGSVKRYREYTSLPGFGIDQISALSFVRELVEWDLPPIVFESVGTPGLYVNWLRPSVFAAGLWADPGNAAFRKNYATVGTQTDLHISILHWYDMTLSVGYAIGYQSSRRADSEWMISLKIM